MRELNVLLIEDNEELCRVIVEAVNTACSQENCNAVVNYSTYGAQGLALYKEGSYDLVIVDINLPDTDGMELIKRIRMQDRVVEFIIITGWPSIETAVEAISLDVWAYFIKPFNTNELVHQAKRAIDNSILKKKIIALADWAGKVLGNGGTNGN
jgi:DNA-binding NtrC family response regulator